MSWTKIKESDKYQINQMGEILGPSGKILKPTMMKVGYFSVAISLGDRKVKRQYVHILVAETFIGKIPSGHVVNHINNVKSDNRLENLEIITRSENTTKWASKNKITKPKKTGVRFCGRGHLIEEAKSYCSTCVTLKRNGTKYYPPEDTDWRESIIPEYLVSKDGRVWSTKTQRVIKHGTTIDGYCYVNMSENKKRKPFTLHKLVATAFLGPIERPNVVDHIDGNKQNNALSNLRVVTQSDNLKFSRLRIIENGKHGFKLCEEDAIKIKQILKEGTITEKEIANMFSVGISLINDIKLGYKWKHIKE
jgi:hypothetical protein